MFCPYRHVFGKEREGVHSYRLFDVAIVDLGLTIIGAWYISKYFNYNFITVFIVAMVLSVVFHRMFCVKSKLVTILFGDK